MGDSAVITLTNHIAGSSIQWQSSSNSTTWTNISGETSAVLDLFPSSNKYYRATVKEAGASCPTYFSDTTYITMVTLPAAPSAGNNTPICSGSTLSLSASTITGATYAWTGPNSFTSTSQNPTISAATSAVAGNYSVTATVAGCKGSVGITNVLANGFYT